MLISDDKPADTSQQWSVSTHPQEQCGDMKQDCAMVNGCGQVLEKEDLGSNLYPSLSVQL